MEEIKPRPVWKARGVVWLLYKCVHIAMFNTLLFHPPIHAWKPDIQSKSSCNTLVSKEEGAAPARIVIFSSAGKTILCSKVYLLRLFDKLGAARTLAHIELPRPLPLDQPLPLETVQHC